MNGSPNIPAWDVHEVSNAAEVIDPSNTPCLIYCSISSICLWCAPLRLVCGWCEQAALSLYMWWGGERKPHPQVTPSIPHSPSLII